MNFNPCFLVPHYNHAQALVGTIARLARYKLPILLIDDGSAPEQFARVQQLAADYPQLRVVRHEQNAGKGAAVIDGMRRAHAAGFTHAFQIDADGQHDTQVVPQFLTAAEREPEALIAGQPVYDASVPKARLYGRRITDFWVIVETWSRDVADAMCGFRVYPLRPMMTLLDRISLPPRMDFDIAVLVRLYWRGVAMRFLPVSVIYPQDGVSHFRVWRDNLHISRAHSRLFFGMLLRSPILLWRKLFGSRSGEHWAQQRERGSMLGIRLLLGLYRIGGRGLFRLFLYPVMLYFFLFSRRARQASLDFLRQAHAQGAPTLTERPGWRHSFRHFLSFAESVLDKFGAWMGSLPTTEMVFVEDAQWQQLTQQGRGSLLIGSHLGNLEVPRAFVRSKRAGAVVTAIVFTEHAKKFNALLKEMQPDANFNLLEVTSIGPDTAIDLRERINRGEMLVIVGDRTPVHSSGRTVRVPFLGRTAEFSLGPYILAHLLECPVHLLFCVREGNLYREYLEPFADRISWTRATRNQVLEQCAARYAQILGQHACRAPYQWFNFFDFWQGEERAETPQAKESVVDVR